MSAHEKLKNIQTKIKAPKNLYNSFGKYHYRNAESICEAVKPYLKREGCSLTLNDEVIPISNWVYVKATATLTDLEDCTSVETSAFAREPMDKKGMDPSQITGSASSYARKYALNGLFLLDDTKDADTDEYKVQEESMNRITTQQVKFLEAEIARTGYTRELIEKNIAKHSKVKRVSLNSLTKEEYEWISENLKNTPTKKQEGTNE